MFGNETTDKRRIEPILDVAACDICGAELSASLVHNVDSPSQLADHDTPGNICPTCLEQILRGELGGEAARPEDEDRPAAPDW